MFPVFGKCPIGQTNALQLLETIRKIDARGTYARGEYLLEWRAKPLSHPRRGILLMLYNLTKRHDYSDGLPAVTFGAQYLSR
ncbi:MAG: hypothetical protein D4R40_00750 [Nitrosomonadaceae bacterium]|nr:MAG: hypothetical protein D4R40_00750 [Nitrosomonadaceae bacterium]